jgi:hypothetical protein
MKVCSSAALRQNSDLYRFLMSIIVTITILDVIHRPPVFYLKLNYIGLSVPHRKHISATSSTG